MKKNLLKLTAFLFCLCFSVSLVAQEKKLNPAPFVGEWSFTVSDAPYGYDKGDAKLFLEEGKLKGEFKLSDATLKVNSFTEKADGFLCTVYVEGYPVDILLTHKDGKLSGRGDDGSQYYPITFKKKE